ncbi:MAG: uracil-DNA glycosylase [Chloroflexota bacterium]
MQSLIDNQSCVHCPALVANRKRIVHGYGDLSARIMFIGEAPGKHGADQTGVPFTQDRSGSRLQRILMTLGLMEEGQPTTHPRWQCFVTNVVRCCPPENRTPMHTEQTNCFPFLIDELTQVDPYLVVPIGRLALRAVAECYLETDPGPIRAAHAIPLRTDSRVIVPMVHPARISNAQIETFTAVMRDLLGEVRRDGLL